jgi:AcrR family transcriptional regulator
MTERLPAARRRRQLFGVALHLFAEQGFHATSMNDIAISAGVTKPVLYQHVPSKRALYLELLDDVGNDLLDTITKATAQANSPADQVRLGFRAFFRYVIDEGDAFRLLFGSGTRRDPEFAEAVERVEDAIAATIAEFIVVDGLDDERRLLLALGLVGMAEATSRHWMRSGTRGDPDALAHQVADLAWHGLRDIRTD